MNKDKADNRRLTHRGVIFVLGMAQAVLLVAIAAVVMWSSFGGARASGSLSSFMSIASVYAALLLVPIAVFNVVAVIRAFTRKNLSLPSVTLSGISLFISVGVLTYAIWIGYTLILLINAANQANSM